MFAVAPVAANATVLLDGSFETKAAAGLSPNGAAITTFCYDSGNPLKCAGGAWSGGGIIKDGAAAWGGTSSPAGNFYAFVQSTQSVSQVFTATRNETGILSWIDTNRSSTNINLSMPKSYIVTISDGVTTDTIASFTSAVGGWVQRTSSMFNLVKNVSYTLSFKGVAPTGDRTAFIDDVSLVTTPLPEPGTWAMLILGFGFIGTIARRSRAFAAG